MLAESKDSPRPSPGGKGYGETLEPGRPQRPAIASRGNQLVRVRASRGGVHRPAFHHPSPGRNSGKVCLGFGNRGVRGDVERLALGIKESRFNRGHMVCVCVCVGSTKGSPIPSPGGKGNGESLVGFGHIGHLARLAIFPGVVQVSKGE
jgi:hypothetical protein